MHKILIPMDDSPNAGRAAEFVAKNFTPDNKITLFNVMLDTAALCDMDSPELTPLFRSQQSSFCTLEDKKRELVTQALDRAREVLLSAGYPPENVTVKVENKRHGVARDILLEAENGYNLIAMGRRGLSSIKEFFIGSTSNKVFHAAKDISVLIVN
jgi:nucleotide-binding universal stress UspA family protein